MSEMRVDGAAAVLRSSPRSAAASEAVGTDSWLAELERARWSAQPRYHAGDGGAGEQASNEAAAEQAENRLQAPTDAQPVAEPAGVQAAAGARTDAQERGTPGPEPQGGADHGALPEPAFVSASSIVAARASGDAVQKIAASASARPVVDSEWAARRVHVHVGEQATSVWVRDARLRPQDAVRLLEQLRPLLAQHPTPSQPVRLTVNGQAVQTQLLEERSNGR